MLTFSHHLVTPFDLHFEFDSGSLLITGGWRKLGALLILFVKPFYSLHPCCSKNNKKPGWKNLPVSEHILVTMPRAFPREIPVHDRVFERRFQPLSIEGVLSNQQEPINDWCPKIPFPMARNDRTCILRPSGRKRLSPKPIIIGLRPVVGPSQRQKCQSVNSPIE